MHTAAMHSLLPAGEGRVSKRMMASFPEFCPHSSPHSSPRQLLRALLYLPTSMWVAGVALSPASMQSSPKGRGESRTHSLAGC